MIQLIKNLIAMNLSLGLVSASFACDQSPDIARFNQQTQALKSEYNTDAADIDKATFKRSEGAPCAKRTWSPSNENEFGGGQVSLNTQEYKLDVTFSKQQKSAGRWSGCEARDFIDCGVLYLRCPHSSKPLMRFMGDKYIFHDVGALSGSRARMIYNQALSETPSCQVAVQPDLSPSGKEIYEGPGRGQKSGQDFDSAAPGKGINNSSR